MKRVVEMVAIYREMKGVEDNACVWTYEVGREDFSALINKDDKVIYETQECYKVWGLSWMLYILIFKN